jgi:hypothetical protein
MGSTVTKTEMRGGTRVSCEIPITLTSLEPDDSFSQDCRIVVVNLRGCAVSIRRAVKPGIAVRLKSIQGKTDITARVVHCISLGKNERLWLVGLSFDKPGNVWGISEPPADWAQSTND